MHPDLNAGAAPRSYHSFGCSGGAKLTRSSSAADNLSKGPPHTMPKSSQDVDKKASNGEVSPERTDEVQSYSSMLSQSATDCLFDVRATSHALSDPKGLSLSTGQSEVAHEGNDNFLFTASLFGAITSYSKESCEPVSGSGWVPQMYGASVGPVSEDKSPNHQEPPMVPEDPKNIFSLSQILYSQGADGNFMSMGRIYNGLL
ncbi:hypothetical protein EN45_083800 [Penicillium chrysogenum]|nr:hypothetical protein N7534_012002 [Penicillium rubens]KZN89747.1 hypothetical protein EN45_083800 [Penicillium chrysogenum]